MDKKKLFKLLRCEEGPKLDFKQMIELNMESGKKELAKDICAIANSNGGRGYIVIGVEDKTKKLVGIKSGVNISEEQIQQIITSRCDPPIPISLEILNIDNLTIGVIVIYDGKQKPYQLRENGAFYIRRGSTTDIMRKQELIEAFEENLNLTAETCPIMNSSIKSIDRELVTLYFKNKNIELTSENERFLLQNSSIIFTDINYGIEKCTLGGLLVFSSINSIYLPHNMIRIINKINTKVKDMIIIQGSLLEMLDKAEIAIKDILPNEYPYKGVMEGIKNAVLYRDYTQVDRVIEVVITQSSISVVSPGQLIKKNRNEIPSYARRNMWIYEKLVTMDEKGRFSRSGNGMFRMKKAFKSIGKVLFINSQIQDSVKVIFPGVKAYSKK
ncbi:Predicted transcriptional regulator, contains HTH domain [Clostridium cavendishii DSM 21758]|uniref:Predicted transcriptional regulator, contains HTH domain n=1 Tax=Clostridium cavendishii DSM 21758 TaxID=1121302 RepID=A0A1M6Q4G5_9CLOT|nr:RNA-binding domain-containing protein [Clostridium cavendishii]SHK15115.1 Predicted transcriptional regulator, contains HTH domain [Clostridium cavendishii DSM 21758]